MSDHPTKPPDDPPDEKKVVVVKEDYDETKYQDSEMEKISVDSSEEDGDGWTRVTTRSKRKSVDELNMPSTKRSSPDIPEIKTELEITPNVKMEGIEDDANFMNIKFEDNIKTETKFEDNIKTETKFEDNIKTETKFEDNIKTETFVQPKNEVIEKMENTTLENTDIKEKDDSSEATDSARPMKKRPIDRLLDNIANLKLDEQHQDQDASEEEIKICFQTMLSPDFVHDKNLSLYIAMGPPVSNFESPIVTMKIDRNVFGNFNIFKGVLNLPKAWRGQNIAYKYFVNKEWEMLPSKGWNSSKAIVNRCLNVPVEANDVYVKYDEVIWKTPWTFEKRNVRNLWRGKAMLAMSPKRSDLKRDFKFIIKNFLAVKRALGNSKNDDQRLLEDGQKISFRRPFDFRQERDWIDFLSKEFDFIKDQDGETDVDRLKCCILQLCLIKEGFNDPYSFNLFMAFVKRKDSKIDFDALFGSVKDQSKLRIAHEICSLTERFCESKVPFKTRQQLWIYSLPLIHWLVGQEMATWLPKCQMNLIGQSWDDMTEILKTDQFFSYTFVRVVDPKTCFDKLLDNDPICQYSNGFGCHLFERLLFSAKDGLPREKIGEDYAYKAMLKLLEANVNEKEPTDWKNLVIGVTKDWSNAHYANPLMLQLSRVLLRLIEKLEDCQSNECLSIFSTRMGYFVQQCRLQEESETRFVADVLQTLRVKEEYFLRCINSFKKLLQNCDPEVCLMCYVYHASEFPPEASKLLLDKQRSLLANSASQRSNNSTWASSLFQKAKDFFGIDQQRNLSLVIESCLEQNVELNQDFEDAVIAYTSGPELSNVIDLVQLIDEQYLTAAEKVKLVHSNVERFFEALVVGNVKIKTIHSFSSTDRLQRCQNLFRGKFETLVYLIELRSFEVKHCLDAEESISQFMKKMESAFEHSLNFNFQVGFHSGDRNRKLKDLCRPRDLQSNETYIERISEVDDTFLDSISRFLKLHASGKLFRKFQNEKFCRFKTDALQIERITDLFPLIGNVLEDFGNFANRLFTSSLTVGEVMEKFSPAQIDEKEKELKELAILLEAPDQGCDQLVQKIRGLFQMKKCMEGAKTLQAIKELFHAKVDLTPLQSILQSELDQQLPLKQVVTNEVLQAGHCFKSWNAEKITDLLKIGKCKNLIEFLRENIRSVPQLKNFVELASISAGEADDEVDRVLLFQAAITGYSPLLLEINWNLELTFERLLNSAHSVIVNIQKDPFLPKRLQEANRLLPWIKAIKERHGSVEESSMTTVEQINNSGVFAIEKSTGIKVEFKQVENFTDDDSITKKTFSIAELSELRSKLILITKGAQGKQIVDRFVSILDLCENLHCNLMKLIQSGCHLFANWKATVYCEKERKVSMLVNYGYSSSGLIHGGSNVESELRQTVAFLKGAYDTWQNFMETLRNDHASLNYFTTDQLVTLSHDMALFRSGQILSPKTSMMLQLVCQLDTKGIARELRRLIGTSMDIDFSSSENEEESPDDTLPTLDPFGDIKENPLFKALRDNFDENTSLAAIINHYDEVEANAVGLQDRLLDWAMENEDQNFDNLHAQYEEKRKKFNDRIEPMDDDAKINTELHTFTDVFDVIEDQSVSLSKKLDLVWNKFLNFINKLDIADYVNFKVIAYILEELSRQPSNLKPSRKMIPTLSVGKPSLIICPEKEMLPVCLSLYAFEESKVLPRNDEVLICSKQTSTEQIELFCRKAFHDQTGRIFCIVHAEMMDYNSCVHVEKILHQSTVSNHQYKLVFLASKESNEKSYISTSLEKFIRPTPPLNYEQLRQYLFSHLQANQEADPSKCNGRIVQSEEAGNGKSLVVKSLTTGFESTIVTHIDTKVIDYNAIVDRLFDKAAKLQSKKAYHFDFSCQATRNKEDLIFQLIVLRGISKPQTGELYLFSELDYCLAEINQFWDKKRVLLDLLPKITCLSPRESLQQLNRNPSAFGLVPISSREGDYFKSFDERLYRESQFQRPYKSLAKLETGEMPEGKGNIMDCLRVILANCCVQNPTWMEISNFTSFLNHQMKLAKNSNFLSPDASEDFPGFRTFVTRFLIQMSKDFSTRSIQISDESQGKGFSKPEIKERQDWESKPHPYLFFNNDGHSLSFFGFFIDKGLRILHAKTGEVLHEKIMNDYLYQGLLRNHVKFNVDLDSKSRLDKLNDLAVVFGLKTMQSLEEAEVDPSYELTSDNMLKMMAIWMRFTVNIPIIIMGETGVGKTRLVNFMCALLRRGRKKQVENFFILKMHGGITEKDVFDIVAKGIKYSRKNSLNGVTTTVIFFDEANTSDAISSIKTVLVDRLVDGEPIPSDIGLRFVAAVNPYREHSPQMITKLENAGLGYHIKANETEDAIGNIPLRRLVYRVKEIPASLFPMIWDFGQLADDTEKKYALQMVKKALTSTSEDSIAKEIPLVVEILNHSQRYMRGRTDESSFVSLRDVERTLKVLNWFLQKEEIVNRVTRELPQYVGHEFLVSLVLSLGVTFYSRLEDRQAYLQQITPNLKLDTAAFELIVTTCQRIFIDEMRLERTIAKNKALMENVWMMAICIELRIPLFLVGKPGSSKSLAKTLVTDVLQGTNSYSDLFQGFKEIHIVSFQCSPLATAGGILSTFRQCQKYQEKRQLEKFTAVAVLDEVGLAEDSLKMPLKALHPLLEDGTIGDEKKSAWKKVSFIGISNWALDPAKMNRGQMLARGVPSEADLIITAQGICQNDEDAYELLRGWIGDLAKGYQKVYDTQTREFFGLRDFYSLIKMLFNRAKTKKSIEFEDIVECTQRNFGGYFDGKRPDIEFLSTMRPGFDCDQLVSPKNLIMASLKMPENPNETRYPLLLTQNSAALKIIKEQKLINNFIIIYGSSFPLDQEYSSICANINRIKIAMETGQQIVLSNLENLYESLYDCLNQNYMMLGDTKYVDLGLGSHRVKCRIHKKFRLLVIANEKDVHEKFPIPLINRLEKQILGWETLLTDHLKQAVTKLKEWAAAFCQVQIAQHNKMQQFKPSDVFIGYHQDALASIVLRLSASLSSSDMSVQVDLVEEAKQMLLVTATPDSMARLSETNLRRQEKEQLCEVYFNSHFTDLGQSLEHALQASRQLLFVTTHSRLLTRQGKENLAQSLNVSVKILPLEQINTESQFAEEISHFLRTTVGRPKILLVQYQFHRKEQNSLIDCARYVIQNKLNELPSVPQQCCIAMVLQVPRIRGGGVFIGIPGNPWSSYHVDELRGDQRNLPIKKMLGKSIPDLIEEELLDLGQLIKDAIPKAVSLKQSERVKRRLEILVEIGDDDDLFHAIFTALVDKIRRDQEESFQPERWLVKMAIRSEYLSEGCTFAKSVWLHLVNSVVAKALADVISRIDAYGDLEHSLVHAASWQRELFYILVKSGEWSDVGMALPKMKNKDWTVKFPFSWLLLKRIERLQGANIDDNILEVINENDFAIAANEAMQDRTEVVKAFASDILALKIPDTALKSSQLLTQLLIKKLIFLARNNCLERVNNVYESRTWQGITIIDVYQAFISIQDRVKCVVEIIGTCRQKCDLLPMIEEADNPSQQDFDLDNIAMSCAIDQLEPKVKGQNFHFEEWIQDVKCLTSVKVSMSNPSAVVQDKWSKLLIVKYFLEYVWNQKNVDKGTREAIFSKVSLLWRLKDINFIHSSKTFDSILKIIKKCSNQAAEKLFNLKNADNCIICQDIFNDPVVLPCGHVACLECLEQTLNQWQCPAAKCKESFPKNFKLAPTKKLENCKFRKGLNMFFLVLLQKLVFTEGGKPPHSEIIKQLMNLVIHKTTKNSDLTTSKKLNILFDRGDIDPKPVVRSFILSMLLKAKDLSAKEDLKTFFKESRFSGALSTELCLLMVFCFEDRLKVQIGNDKIIALEWLKEFLDQPSLLNEISVESLFLISKLRLALGASYFGQDIGALLKDDLNPKMEPWIKCVQKVTELDRTETLKKYLVRVVVEITRQGCIETWKNNAILGSLLPKDILSSGPDNIHDFFLFFELKDLKVPYRRIRDAMRADLMSGKLEQLLHLQQNNLGYQNHSTVYQLALHNLFCVSKCQVKNDDVIEAIAQLSRPLCDAVNDALKKSSEPKIVNDDQGGLAVLIQHCRVVFCKSKSTGFSKLSQGKLSQFLPTMPHDEVFDTLKGLIRNPQNATKMFYCPNGHPYAIGDCGQPRQVARCPCGAPIGGENYRFADGGQNVQQRQQVDQKDSTKSGYLLGPSEQLQPTIGVREINKLEVLIVRFLLHSSMLLGAKDHPKEIQQLISCRPQLQNINAFLIGHLKSNLSQIARCLSANEESSQVLLHKIIHKMSQWTSKSEWNTKESIKSWENSFAKEVIRPVTSTMQLNNDMKDLLVLFKEDMDGAKSAVLSVLEEEGKDALAKSVWQPQFWHPRVSWNIDKLEQDLGGRKKLKDKCPYLFRLLSAAVEKKVLREAVHLPEVLQLQRYICNLFDGNLDLHAISKLSVQDFFLRYWPHDSDKPTWKKRLESYLNLLDRLKPMIFEETGSLGMEARRSLELDHHPGDDKVCMSSNATVLFPNSHGLGKFSLAIVRLLVEAHNACLDTNRILRMDEISNDTTNFISCDTDDLDLILLANSQYELEICGKGQATKPDIDIEGLESMIYEKYFKRPKYDFTTAPRFKFRHQQLDLSKLSDKIEQEKRLPLNIVNQLERELKGAQEVGYIISQVAIVRDVLAGVGHMKKNELILDFMKRLRIKIKGDYKALEKITLTQIQCLLRSLNLIRAKMLTLSREDPFMAILSDELKEPISSQEIEEKIFEFCHHVRPDLILESLHSCITDKLTTFNPSEDEHYLGMSLRDLIVPYLEAMDENEKAIQFQMLDQKILVKNAAYVFRTIVTHKFDKC